MDDICERIREQLPELIDSGLSPEKAVELEQHRSQCPACNEYFEALEADDRLLCEFTQAMRPSLTRLENITMDELRRRRLGRSAQIAPASGGILSSRVAKIAAAVLAVATILIGAVMFRDTGEKPAETVRLSDESGMSPTEPPREDEPDLKALVEAELQEIRRMIEASDIASMTAMLNKGQPQSKIAAANYLATAGDARLIGTLAQLAAEWQGDPAMNPFAAAIAQIMNRLQQQEQKSESAEDDGIDEAVAETTAISGEDEVGCRGIVVDEQGGAIAGARVLLYHNKNRWGLGNRVLEETVSTADGSFVCRQRIEFSNLKELSYAQEADMQMTTHSEYVLMATHPDYAFGWRNFRQGSDQDKYRIVLTKPTSRTITVTDYDGNPLPGVRVWPSSVGDSESPRAIFRDYLILAADVGLIPGATDGGGQTVIKNLPDTGFSLRATLEGYADGVYIPALAGIRMRKGAALSGWVLADGNKPVPGAMVSLSPNGRYNYFLALTDSEGAFHLDDLPAQGWDPASSDDFSGSYTVTIKHELYAAEAAEVTLLPGQSIDDFIIEARGDTTLIECRVVEFGTNVPVAGARIHGWNRIGKFSGYSDSEGVFAVRVLPGLVQLSFHSPPKGVYVLNERPPDQSLLSFDASGRKMSVVLNTPPIAGLLRSVSGIVIAPDGMAQSEGETIIYAGTRRIRTSIGSSAEKPTWVDGDGRFELKEVPTGRKLHIYAATKDHTLAGSDVFEIPDDPDWSGVLKINLEPTQSAAVVVSDNDGNVVADAEVRIEPMVQGERISAADRRTRTDENGLLELDGILPGLEYYISAIEPKTSAESSLETRGEILTMKMVLVPLMPQ